MIRDPREARAIPATHDRLARLSTASPTAPGIGWTLLGVLPSLLDLLQQHVGVAHADRAHLAARVLVFEGGARRRQFPPFPSYVDLFVLFKRSSFPPIFLGRALGPTQFVGMELRANITKNAGLARQGHCVSTFQGSESWVR